MFQGLGVRPASSTSKLTATNFGLRLNYYPPMTSAQDGSGAGRLLGHEDVDLFTILPATPVEGLQVWNHRTANGCGCTRPPDRSSSTPATICSGSPTTCCPRPPTASASPATARIWRQARVSFPIAVYVWEDELLEVLPGLGEPKYEPVKAIAFHTRSTSKFYGDDYAVESA